MSLFSTSRNVALGGIFCLCQPASAAGLFGDVMAPPKRSGAVMMGSADLVPLQRQKIDICNLTGEQCQSQFTDDQGFFEFQDLQQGTYKLQTLGSDGKLLNNQIEVAPNASSQVTIIAK